MKGADSKRKHRVALFALLAIVVLAGTYLRFANLGRLDLWIDEPYHLYSAQSLNETGEPYLPSGVRYARAPLYTRLVAVSFRLFGLSEFSVRFPSAFLGVVGIVAVFWMGRYLFSGKVGLLAAFFIAFSYYALAWSRISRFYTLFQLFYMVGVFLVFKGLEGIPQSLAQVGKDVFKKSFLLKIGVMVLGLAALLVSYKTQLIATMFFPVLLSYVAIVLVYDWARDRKVMGRTYLVFVCSIHVPILSPRRASAA